MKPLGNPHVSVYHHQGPEVKPQFERSSLIPVSRAGEEAELRRGTRSNNPGAGAGMHWVRTGAGAVQSSFRALTHSRRRTNHISMM